MSPIRHDHQCELTRNRGHGCYCGSRACPLCDGCKDGRHLTHDPWFRTTVPSSAGTVKVDLECTCPACVDKTRAGLNDAANRRAM